MSNRVRLTMAQALLRYLGQQFVERDGTTNKFVQGVIGIFGHGNVMGIGEALEYEAEVLPYIQGHNEQGMVHAAVAFAKQRNRRSIYACTSSIGPGALNMVTAAAGATINRIPVLLLPGDAFADRQPDPVLQQLEGGTDRTATVNDAFKSVSVYWDRIVRPEQLLSSLPEVLSILTDPAMTGAATLALPQDVQSEAYDYPLSFFEPRIWSIGRPLVDEKMLQSAVSLMSTKKRPLIIVGGGVLYSEAMDAVAAFAEQFHIPLVETQAGKGAIPWDNPWNVGAIGVTGSRSGNQLAREADLIIAVGTRLADFTTASKSLFNNPDVNFLSLNVNRRDAVKMNAFPLVGDAKKGLWALNERLMSIHYQSTYDRGEIMELKNTWNHEVEVLFQPRERSTVLGQTQALGVLHSALEPSAVIVAAAGSLPGDLHRLWRVKQEKAYHLEYGFSCMGYEVAGALGVKWAQPDRDVYALVGDGSFLLMHSELYTSLQENTKITVVVFDNRGFGSINGLQKAHGSRGFGTEFRRRTIDGELTGPKLPVDFASLAEAMGACGYRASTEDALRQALMSARQESRSCVIDVKVEMGTGTKDSGGWWRLGVPAVSESEAVRKAHQDMEEEKSRVRW